MAPTATTLDRPMSLKKASLKGKVKITATQLKIDKGNFFDEPIGFGIIRPSESEFEIIRVTAVTPAADGDVLTILRNGPVFGAFVANTAVNEHPDSAEIVFGTVHNYVDALMDAFNAHEITGAHEFLGTFLQASEPDPTANTDQIYFRLDDNNMYRSDGVNWIVDAGGSQPDASTSTKGIVQMSETPVSPTLPIAVGDNDVRVNGGFKLDMNSMKRSYKNIINSDDSDGTWANASDDLVNFLTSGKSKKVNSTGSTTNGNVPFGSALDLTEFADGLTVADDDDYIRFTLKCDDFTAVQAVTLRLETTATTDSFDYVATTDFVNNNVFTVNVQKSAFASTGSPDWSNINQFTLDVDSNGPTLDVTIMAVQLVDDAGFLYDGSNDIFTRDGYSFADRRDYVLDSVAGITAYIWADSALGPVAPLTDYIYEDFYAQVEYIDLGNAAKGISDSNKRFDFGWNGSDTDFVEVFADGTNLRVEETVASSANVIATIPHGLTIPAAGDVRIRFRVRKVGTFLEVWMSTIIDNKVANYEVYLSATLAGVSKGRAGIRASNANAITDYAIAPLHTTAVAQIADLARRLDPASDDDYIFGIVGASETILDGDAVSVFDGFAFQADATSPGAAFSFRGIARTNGKTVKAGETFLIQTQGQFPITTTAGEDLFVSETPGEITGNQNAVTNKFKIARGINTTHAIIDIGPKVIRHIQTFTSTTPVTLTGFKNVPTRIDCVAHHNHGGTGGNGGGISTGFFDQTRRVQSSVGFGTNGGGAGVFTPVFSHSDTRIANLGTGGVGTGLTITTTDSTIILTPNYTNSPTSLDVKLMITFD